MSADDRCALRLRDTSLYDLPHHHARRRLLRQLGDGFVAQALIDIGILEFHGSTRGRPHSAGAPAPPGPPRPSQKLAAMYAQAQILAQTDELHITDIESMHATAPAALPALRAALAVAPRDPRIHHALGSALLPRRGDFSEPRLKPLCECAFMHLQRAAELAPECTLLHMKSGTVAIRARSRTELEVANLFAVAVATNASSRAATQHWITALQWAGQHGRATSVAHRSVQEGLWELAMQRPAKFTAGLTAKPFWRADDVAPKLCQALQAAAGTLRAELATLQAADAGCATQDEGLHAANSSWRVCDVMRRCEVADPRVHSTCSVLLRWEAEQGQLIHSAQFSLLTGGGHIRSHVGSTNRRLFLHFSLTGSGAAIRVGTRWRKLVPGRCLGLDDSFEHEVVHAGRELRVTLVVQLLHPDLRPVRALRGSALRSSTSLEPSSTKYNKRLIQ